MKPLPENRSDEVMKYFTPGLFVRFNSPDDAVADQANDEWELAVQAYQKHLDAIREQMPVQVQRLADLCLHDSEILASEQLVEPIGNLYPPPFEFLPLWTGYSILSAKHEDEVFSLIYFLRDQVRVHPSPGDWPFSKDRLHWLYDEVDVSASQRGAFTHRVLLSDGSILEIPFQAVLIHSFPMRETVENSATRRIA